VLSLLGCSPSSPQEEEPPSEAPEIYAITPTWCHGACWSLTLYRAETFIELRAHDRGDNTFLGLATGILSDPASDELDQLIDEAGLGEPSGPESFDAPLIDLWLPGLQVTYDQGNPPSGLVELDAFLAKTLDDMSQCRPTTKITPDHDCEPLAWYPE
jgi:hypothetical protein